MPEIDFWPLTIHNITYRLVEVCSKRKVCTRFNSVNEVDLGFSEDFKISGKRDGLYPNEGSMVEALPCSYCLRKGGLRHILRSYKELSLEFSNI
jgi:hypothetical protein